MDLYDLILAEALSSIFFAAGSLPWATHTTTVKKAQKKLNITFIWKI
jgi:hypothetical protein